MTLLVTPATPDRWPDVERLFGPNGAFSHCWCTWNWLTGRAFHALRPEERKELLRRRVLAGPPPGVLGFLDGEPVAWCAIAPRASFQRLARSRAAAPIDDAPVWSLTCLFIARPFRGRGLLRPLVQGALAYARAAGAPAVEAYPIDHEGPLPPSQLYRGTVRLLRDLGFVEVARPQPQRPIMRYVFRDREPL